MNNETLNAPIAAPSCIRAWWCWRCWAGADLRGAGGLDDVKVLGRAA